MNLSKEARMIAGIVAITVPTVEFGGVFLLGMIDAHDPGYLENRSASVSCARRASRPRIRVPEVARSSRPQLFVNGTSHANKSA